MMTLKRLTTNIDRLFDQLESCEDDMHLEAVKADLSKAMSQLDDHVHWSLMPIVTRIKIRYLSLKWRVDKMRIVHGHRLYGKIMRPVRRSK